MKKTEREMLVLAAKAAGIPIKHCTCSNPNYPFAHDEDASGKHGHWNPLVRDGDALRLAAKLKIDLEWQHDDDAVEAYVRVVEGSTYCPSYPSSEYRRAIVDVAAKLGESMP